MIRLPKFFASNSENASFFDTKQVKEEVKKPIDIFEAADMLQAKCEGQPWFVAVGVDVEGDILFLYVKEINSDLVKYTEGFDGYVVKVRKMGQPKPA